ncbi:hypothetical protein PSI9734_01642 [Pseudidiomarina piscicola]|uniref:Uncharacterized protein n=1 Tax=Pseudidiomarina piscicola TaxID=2614830 RepID=A0A6S6WPQ2_9GAMM|nr:hypothetical protein [Pseudidiomarina piscicola]CAB0151229.1 hypothetical protein PSI9734_01642 [Pseudidiomarina piscicola]VZT40735.1 hypothetical protein PSI9734_01642 [Pseudomonas aeruginosa]
MQPIQLIRLRDRLSEIMRRQLKYDDIFSQFVRNCEGFFNVEMKDELKGSVPCFERTPDENQAILKLAKREYIFDLLTLPGEHNTLTGLLRACRKNTLRDGKVAIVEIGEIRINGHGACLTTDGERSERYNIQSQDECIELVIRWIEQDCLGEQE